MNWDFLGTVVGVTASLSFVFDLFHKYIADKAIYEKRLIRTSSAIEQFNSLIVTIYGEKWLSLRCFFASALISCVFFIIMLLLIAAITGDLQSGSFSIFLFFLALFLLAPVNVLADYLSLLVTRFCIRILKSLSLKSPLALIKAVFVIVFDIVVSIFVSLFVFTLIFSIAFGGPTGFSVIEQVMFPIFAGFIFVFEPPAQEVATQQVQEEPLMKLDIFGPPTNSSQIIGFSFLITSLSTTLWLVYFSATKILKGLLHGNVTSQRRGGPVNPIYQYPATVLSVSLIPVWILIAAM